MPDKIRILVADKLAPKGLDYLRSFDNVEVETKTGLSEDELAAIIGDYHGLLVRSGVQVTAKVLDQPGKLRAIARAGVGVDNIDLDAATQHGVLVMNSAEASTITTAEHAFALMMALARNIGPAYRTMADGGWDRKKFVGAQLAGKDLGIVGFGRIGRTVAERALAFGMNVVAFDPVYNAATALDGRVKMYSDFDAMLPECDILTFHVPLNDHTRGMLNADRFNKCREGLMVVNAARGGVIDIPALIEALDAGKCGGAAIDVYEEEPPAEDDPIRTHPRILCTPHLGASTAEAQEAVSTDACAQILEYLRGEGLRGAVNLGGVRMDLDETQQRFGDLVERMAQLVAPTCEQGISSVSLTVEGKEVGAAAGTYERMAVIELLRAQMDLPVNMVNVQLIARQRGIKHSTTIVEGDGPASKITVQVTSGGATRRAVGTVYPDGLPRVLELNGYYMDLVPDGPMLIIQNDDRPGMVGVVGTLLGDAGLNIADMALSHRDNTALMVLNLDAMPDKQLLATLRQTPGIRKIASLRLPSLSQQ